MEYSSLLATIDANIRANGNEEITGPVLNGVLRSMVSALGNGFQFKGIAQPGDNPGTPDAKVFYIATTPGTYANFGGATVTTGQIVALSFDTSWHAAVLITAAALNGSSSEDFEAKVMHAFQVISDTSVIGKEVVGETVAGDKLQLHNSENEALTDIVPGGQSEDVEVVAPSKSGTLALQEDVDEALKQKANIDGFYGGMTVGAAENLVGRGSVPAEIQGIRTSAGTADIGSGAAQITKFKGASIVWNQLVQNGNFESTSGWMGVGGTIAAANNVLTFTAGSNVGTSSRIQQSISTRNGPVYAIRFTVESSAATQIKFGIPGSTAITSDNIGAGEKKELSYVKQLFRDANLFYLYVNTTGTLSEGDTVKFSNVMYLDLTLMFGATIAAAMTVEQLERMFPLPYYAYNAGRIRNNEATGIKTVGFNLYNHATGKAVLPGKYSSNPLEYEICGTFTSISFEDYAGNVSTPELTDGRFFNVDRPGVLTVVGGNDTDTLVHLVWSGWRNSDQPDYAYEPYWENILPLNIKTIKGKLNGAGESMVIFPDGMRGAGNVYDYLIVEADGYARTAVKVTNSVDLGTLTWTLSSANNTFYSSNLIDKFRGNTNILSQKYIVADVSWMAMPDKSIKGNTTGTNIWAHDSDYSTAAAFKAAMNGVELIYQLAAPQFYTLDEPIFMGYRVDDFGTEAKLPVDTADNVTAPIAFDVRYPMNAVDAIRNLPTNFLSKESTQNLLSALQSAGIIGGYTMTYDATAKEYNFAITAPTAPESNEA